MTDDPKQFQHNYNEDRSRVTITSNGYSIDVSATELERLIVDLGVLRSQMKPSVPLTPPTDKALRFTEVKVVKVDNGSPHGLIFFARSELFGWFSATMHLDWRQQLLRYLSDDASEAPAGATLH